MVTLSETSPLLKTVPKPDQTVGLRALRGIFRRKSILGALDVLHHEMGDVFRLNVPGFNPVMLVGPEAARFVLVTSREDVRWRMEHEPITILLRHGVLVEDGESHDAIRRAMNPALHKTMLAKQVEAMWRGADQVTQRWTTEKSLDMLVEMRKAALLILTDALFGVDFAPDLERLWPGVLRAVQYISPGPWVVWRGLSPLGYDHRLKQIDAYLYRIIAERRRSPRNPDDLIGVLLAAGLDDGLIRDQLMTMLIAGHDTSTASLAWALYLLGAHPAALAKAQAEVRSVLGDQPPTIEDLPRLSYLDQCIDETLRLYPPIHLGSRVAAADLAFDGYHIPAGTRILYSIYLTQRHPAYWEQPTVFLPERFDKGSKIPPYAFLPFGGGPRNCIGAAFAQVEAKVVLARLLQQFTFTLVEKTVHPHMGATLEPRPGVRMLVKRC